MVGVHVHVGSQITSLEPLSRAAEAGGRRCRGLRADGSPLYHLDLGGGLGIVYDGGDVPTYDAFARALVDVARPTGLSLIVEPGRTLVGPAGVLLARVIDVKPSRRRRPLRRARRRHDRTDAAGALRRVPSHRAGAAARPAPPCPCDVVGPVCESSDTFARDRELPPTRTSATWWRSWMPARTAR